MVSRNPKMEEVTVPHTWNLTEQQFNNEERLDGTVN